jgi:hypothetical protein
LCFVQRYKHQLTAVDKAALQRLSRSQHHHLVSAAFALGRAAFFRPAARSAQFPQRLGPGVGPP